MFVCPKLIESGYLHNQDARKTRTHNKDINLIRLLKACLADTFLKLRLIIVTINQIWRLNLQCVNFKILSIALAPGSVSMVFVRNVSRPICIYL